ncbi:exopolysaccharide biosynthesis protein [Thioclava sp. SK-1]|uniref:sugar transferase n=1 Tax=Thioclava sp. SK-1 TaxID=1889770 RepID=UPI0008251A99|nr:sugar transferase [Thioclava sp. SK-1]OCX66389.1 exopolysaccharide biosynthesis protein [Thioclava sp. SK-1]
MKFALTAQSRQTALRDGLGTVAYRRLGKRPFDIFLALLLLPILLPVIAGLWFLVRRDGGSGFFVQPRIGRDGRVFNCYKLRTMVTDAEAALKKMCDESPELAHEWHVNQKLTVDPRITRVGRFLRATSLDELPQVFNVIKGDMSFVGPRPFLVDQEALYRNAGGESYFDMRPGITGAWQVEGRNSTTFIGRVAYDDDYHRGLSMWRDIGLIAKTAGIVCKRTGR